MESEWDTIENIIGSDAAYNEFRAHTKQFLHSNSISIHSFSIETGLSRAILTAFLRDGYRRLSFRTLSKMINYMDNYGH